MAYLSSDTVRKRGSNEGRKGRVLGDKADQGRLRAAGDEASERGLSELLAQVFVRLLFSMGGGGV